MGHQNQRARMKCYCSSAHARVCFFLRLCVALLTSHSRAVADGSKSFRPILCNHTFLLVRFCLPRGMQNNFLPSSVRFRHPNAQQQGISDLPERNHRTTCIAEQAKRALSSRGAGSFMAGQGHVSQISLSRAPSAS